MTDHAPSKGRARENVGLYIDAQTLPGVKRYRRDFIVREAIRISLKIATPMLIIGAVLSPNSAFQRWVRTEPSL
jgi:hypothetical protein